MTLWNNNKAVKATGGVCVTEWKAARVEIDSRRVQEGDLFVAIKGERMDGHDFVEQAFAAGASAAMVSQPMGGPVLLVEDTLKGLEKLATYARAQSHAKIVGVTGSVGKTSTKEMLRMALAGHGSVYATTGNFNNHIGTPLNLANLHPDTEYAVFEMGMNHAGEIASLTQMVKPHVAVISNVESVHLEFFENEEGIADAKAEIFQGVPRGGAAVLNCDNRHYDRLRAAAKEHGISQVVACGEAGAANSRLLKYRPLPTGCEIKANVYGHTVDYKLSVIGRHWVMTSLLTLGVAYTLGLDVQETALSLEHFSEPEGRGRIARLPLKHGSMTLIDDSYNASPVSTRAAIAKLADTWRASDGIGRKIVVLGDMLELGETAPQLHAALADDIQKAGVDMVFTAGALMRHLHDALPAGAKSAHVAQADELFEMLLASVQPDDIVLIKGSHGSKMYELAARFIQSLKEMK